LPETLVAEAVITQVPAAKTVTTPVEELTEQVLLVVVN
jgi:hypothetical protein